MNKDSSRFSLKGYIYSLVAVMLVLFAFLMGYLIWDTAQDRQMSNQANEYHLHIAFCTRIKEELSALEKALLIMDQKWGAEFIYDPLGQTPINRYGNSQDVNGFLYEIQKNLDHILKLQKTYAGEEFSNTLQRAQRQFQTIEALFNKVEIRDIRDRSTLKEAFFPFLISMTQLQRIHDAAHSELEEKILIRKNVKARNLIIFFGLTFFMGFFMVRRILGMISETIKRQREGETALRESEERVRTIMDNATTVIYLKNANGQYLLINRQFEKLFHISRDRIKGKTDHDIFPKEMADAYRENDQKVLEADQPLEFEEVVHHDDGPHTYISIKFPLRHSAKEVYGICGISTDITGHKKVAEERRDMERKIQHTQKLESLGILAGGIAHDFNNLLMGILGHADRAQMELPPESPALQEIEQIEVAARGAAELTNQMLAYSGKGKFVSKTLKLCEIVEEMTHMLQTVISKKAILKFNFASNLPLIEGDPSQIRQVIMNLIINGSDAIGDKSGVISVSTGVMEADRSYIDTTFPGEELSEGYYVYLEVSDTGCGIDKETLGKIFDPFFTTKFTGRGLGLSALLGIVKSHKGALKVYSEPGKGSTFKVLFPATNNQEESPQEPVKKKEDWKSGGKILVVDDEESVRVLAKKILEKHGFSVLTACDGREGVEKFQKYSNEIRVVILDMTMPGLNGAEVFREIRRIKNDALVILSSGFTEQDAAPQFAGKGLAGFIQKPYHLHDLVEKVRLVLKT